MKISELLQNDNHGAYILGNIFAFQYKLDDDFISIFIGKEQKNKIGNEHIINIDKDFKDILFRAQKYYNVNLLDLYFNINENERIKKILRRSIGIASIIKNDIDKDLDSVVSEKINSHSNKVFVLNFIRGVIDARSSADTTTSYIAMDIRKKQTISFAYIMKQAFYKIFGQKIQYNINPRFKQRSMKSRLKNPQFRVPYTVVFGVIGTFRMQFLRKLFQNKNEFKKFKTLSMIPENFPDLIKWDTSKIIYKPRSINNFDILEGDIDYVNNYSPEKESLLYTKLKEKYPSILSYKKDVWKFTDELLQNVLNKTKSKDFLDSNKEIEINKKGDPLIDIHHIIPRSYRHIFIEKKNVDDIANLVPLRQDTHYFLHRGAFSENKIKYLKDLFDHVKPFLLNKTRKKIDFNEFILMY